MNQQNVHNKLGVTQKIKKIINFDDNAGKVYISILISSSYFFGCIPMHVCRVTLAALAVTMANQYFLTYFGIMLYPIGVDRNEGGQLRCNRDGSKDDQCQHQRNIV